MAQVAKRLLDLGADVEATYVGDDPRDPTHHFAFLDAVYNGRDAFVRLLLDSGANPNRALTCKFGDGFASLHVAAGYQPHLADLLLERGADVGRAMTTGDPKAKGGIQALHVAAAAGHADAVDVLLKRGADATATFVATKWLDTWFTRQAKGTALSPLDLARQPVRGPGRDGPPCTTPAAADSRDRCVALLEAAVVARRTADVAT